MGKNIKVFIIAGEPSGDLWGASIVRELMAQGFIVNGLGGPEMKAAGLKSIGSITPLSIMGLFEVLKNIREIYKIYKKTHKAILDFKPDILLTIDSPGFNFRMAKAIKKDLPHTKRVHFVAPQVWAWKPQRAAKTAALFDHLLCLFSFEPKYFKPHGLETSVVGHPVIESGVLEGSAKNFKEKYKIESDEQVISLLPGSRLNEIERLLPILLKSAETLSYTFPNARFFIPTLENTHDLIKAELQKHTLPIKLIKGTSQDRYDLFAASNLALASSGSVSIELALAKVPHCVCYRFNPLTYWIGKKLVQTKFANLFNIALNQEMIPEFIQENCTPEKLSYFGFSILSSEKNTLLFQKNMAHGIDVLLPKQTQTPTQKIIEAIEKIVS